MSGMYPVFPGSLFYRPFKLINGRFPGVPFFQKGGASRSFLQDVPNADLSNIPLR